MSEIKPALSPEEWADVLDYVGLYAETVARMRAGLGVADTSHSLAALALHGQPFGFTWKGVEMLRAVARDIGHHQGWDQFDAASIAAVADRIAALLPPREP